MINEIVLQLLQFGKQNMTYATNMSGNMKFGTDDYIMPYVEILM
jgi:hypothetical protein